MVFVSAHVCSKAGRSVKKYPFCKLVIERVTCVLCAQP